MCFTPALYRLMVLTTSIAQVQAKLGEFLKFVQKNSDTFFLSQYMRRELLNDTLNNPSSSAAASSEVEGTKPVDSGASAAAPASAEEPMAMDEKAGVGSVPTPMEVA